MLVVLLIAGLLMGLASLSMTRNPRTELNEQAMRVALLFETAADEAQVRARPIEWRPGPNGYGFFERTRDGWQPMRDDLLGARHWDAGITGVTIRYTGASNTASSVAFGVESIDHPVTVTLFAGDGRVSIRGNGDGSFVVR